MSNVVLVSVFALCIVGMVAIMRRRQAQVDPSGFKALNRAMVAALIAFCVPLLCFLAWAWWNGDQPESGAALGFALWLFVVPGALILSLVTFFSGLILFKPRSDSPARL